MLFRLLIAKFTLLSRAHNGLRRLMLRAHAARGIIALAAAVASAQGLASGLPQPRLLSLDALEAEIIQRLAQAEVPGAAVVIIEDRRVVATYLHGVADRRTGRKVDVQTIFRAGSISKTFTALAVGALVEDKRLNWEDPVQWHLPQWRHDNPWSASDPVRLIHLLEHTSGLDDVRYRHYLLNSSTMPLAEAIDQFGPYAVRWKPGSATSYSNAGAVVAGRVIELASQRPFPEFVAARLAGPMGMSSAHWVRTEAFESRLAKSYAEDGKTLEPFVDTPARPSGSLNVTPLDLARLPLMLLNGGIVNGQVVVKPDTIAWMQTPFTGATTAGRNPDAAMSFSKEKPAHEIAGPAPKNSAFQNLGWGAGLQADAQGRSVFFKHDGSIDGFVATFAYSPSLGSGYVIMANALSPVPMQLSGLVRGYLERDLPLPVVQAVPITAAQREAWAGQYQSITPRQELLRAIIGLTQWEGATFVENTLTYGGKNWQHVGDGYFQAHGASRPELALLPTSGLIGSAGRTLAVTPDGARRRVHTFELWVKPGVLGLSAVLLPLSLGMLGYWLWSGIRRALGQSLPGSRSGGYWAQRILPTIAWWSALSIPMGVLALLATGDLKWLGEATWAGWTIAAMGVLSPLLCGWAAWSLLRYPKSWLTAWGASQVLLAALTLGWLGAHGWLGLRVWH